MVNIQIRDITPEVRDVLAESAKSRGQSMQTYLRMLLEEDAMRANNVAVLRRVRGTAGGSSDDTASVIVEEIREARAARDARNTEGS